MLFHDDLNEPTRMAALQTGATKALLINPPIYDTQYWARWSQPHGLLKVAAWLKQIGYTHLWLIDCLAVDEKRQVRYRVNRERTVLRGDMIKTFYTFGMSLDELRSQIRRLCAEQFVPEEVWITSIMTYWWESTRDVVQVALEELPHAQIRVGGVYPTLAPWHAEERVAALAPERITIVQGEIYAASDLPTDLSLYDAEHSYHSRIPGFALITGSRGCPFNCAYCAQLQLNANIRRVRRRTASDIADEIEDKHRRHGVREFAFYEDNLLIVKDEFMALMEEIISRGLHVRLFAPEGMEPRLIDHDLMRLMSGAGFQKIHLALETMDEEISRGWNRRHARFWQFERAVDICRAYFANGKQEGVNAFVLFGMPDEDLQAVVNTALYAAQYVGSVIPMLFTPVPGSQMFDQFRDYLLGARCWDLHDLNGKLLPFLEHNQRHYPDLKATDYLKLEAFMAHLNQGKVRSQSFAFGADGPVARAFRRTLAAVE
jgi:hypothetical protein